MTCTICFPTRTKIRLVFMLTLLLAFVIQEKSHAYQNPEIVKVNARRLDKLNLSQIAEEVIKISFELPPKGGYTFGKTIFNEKYVFMTVRYNGSSGLANQILQYDKTGKFIREIGKKSDWPIGISYNPDTQGFIRYNGKQLYFYDKNGDLTDSITSQLKYLTYHKKYLWAVKIERIEEQWHYQLVKSDLSGRNITSLYTTKDPHNRIVGLHITPLTSGDKLYLSLGMKHGIEAIKDDMLQPAFDFKITPSYEKAFDMIFPSSFFVGNWVHFGYNHLRGSHIFLYNTKSKEQYNLNLKVSGNGRLISGISDDIHNTGLFRMRSTNLNDQFYFTRREGEQLIIYLAKIKP